MVRIDCGNKCFIFTNRRMPQNRISDLDTAMFAKRSFDSILEQVQASNLNFQLQISPFSATISLKKTLIKDKLGNLLLPPSPIHFKHEDFER
jgi:hypothetical protein